MKTQHSTAPSPTTSSRFGLLSMIVLAGCALQACKSASPADPVAFRRHHIAYRAAQAPVIDGALDDAAWLATPAMESFIDIRGAGAPDALYETRAKVMWDDTHLYIGVEMQEPHLWGTLTERDSVVFLDKAFEVFLDPNGDTLDYYEFQINALGTIWDLLLDKPYSAGGQPLSSFDTPGLKSAVHLNGSLNDGRDLDEGWSVELAIPFAALEQMAGRPLPPEDGDVWWVNLSRVQWKLDVAEDGRGYAKQVNEAGKPLAETYWVWSPQGEVNMHKPETWGLVMFADSAAGEERAFVLPAGVIR